MADKESVLMEDGIIVGYNDFICDDDSPKWDKLIEEISNGNVIPVICPDVLTEGRNLHRRLVDAVAKWAGVGSDPQSFSELVNDHDYLKKVNNESDYIYKIINKIFTVNVFPPSDILKELVSIRQFPFVITTSFTPVVENAMREVWGDKLEVMVFSNDPSKNQDISGEVDFRKPILYYLFGKVGDHEHNIAHSYVLTDNDMLDFCCSWMPNTGKHPHNLAEGLKNKYLLVLGNTYSDWLFRFIWYVFRKPQIKDRKIEPSCYVGDTENESLSHFLEHNKTFLTQNPRDVLRRIKELLPDRLKYEESTKFDKPDENADIFISYSRSDSAIALELYDQLTAMGKRVWYDRNDISSGGKFMDEIHHGIEVARYFVPIFSHNIEKEKNDPHVYRQEWEYASIKSISMGRTFIIPIAEKGFDFYRASIPERMRQHNAIEFSTPESIAEVAKKILQVINKG